MVHSVAGEPIGAILAGARPFRCVHHSASMAGLVGGGTPVRPGKISLAHEGVLFLDELPEFSPAALQALRQPMEQGSITVTRADGSVKMPARFMTVAAANPCPCGYFGDPERACTCTPSQVSRYQGRIGGPLLDRIDMHIDVWRCDPGSIIHGGESAGATSAELSVGVCAAREFARWRIEALGDEDGDSTASLLSRCRLDSSGEALLESVAKSQGLSGRGIARVLSVARTIADMGESKRVGESHLVEAIGFRMRGCL